MASVVIRFSFFIPRHTFLICNSHTSKHSFCMKTLLFTSLTNTRIIYNHVLKGLFKSLRGINVCVFVKGLKTTRIHVIIKDRLITDVSIDRASDVSPNIFQQHYYAYKHYSTEHKNILMNRYKTICHIN